LDRQQAEELESYICIERKPDTVRVHQVASGEYVVILLSECYWLWSPSDWTVFRQQEEDSKRTSHKSPRTRETCTELPVGITNHLY
jgi:DNA gyrase inhibitor GyrI